MNAPASIAITPVLVADLLAEAPARRSLRRRGASYLRIRASFAPATEDKPGYPTYGSLGRYTIAGSIRTPVDPAAEIAALKTRVTAFGLAKGVSTALNSKLDEALVALAAKNIASACVSLKAFTSQVHAQREEEADRRAGAAAHERCERASRTPRLLDRDNLRSRGMLRSLARSKVSDRVRGAP